MILDVAMPGMTGPQLQTELIRRDFQIPIAFITAHSNERLNATLLSQGAVACLDKPFSEAALSEAVSAALARGRT